MSDFFKKTQIDNNKSGKYPERHVITYAIKVPYGWLIETIATLYADTNQGVTSSVSTSQTFISDPNHEWSVEQLTGSRT